MRRYLISLAAVIGVGLIPSASASAQVVLGQLAPPGKFGECVNGPVQFFQVQLTSGPSYTAPSPGLLTSWSTNAGPGKGQLLEFKVFRPTGLGVWTVVAHDGPRPLVANTTNTFPIELHVQAGDVVGVTDIKGKSPTACFFGSGAAGDLVGDFFGDTPDGGVFTEGKHEGSSTRVNVSATLLGPPTISALGVAEGSIEGGTTVVIAGSEFARVSGVAFGGVPAQSFTVDSEGQLTAVAPAVARPGKVGVTVSTAIGSAISPQAFTYQGCVVPKLKGRLLKASRKKILAGDCKVGKLARRRGATARTGRVVKQVPKPGSVLAPGTKIRVTLGR